MQIATNLDRDLVRRAQEETGIDDMTELLNAGLRRLVRNKKQERAIRGLHGSVDWQGDLDEWRRD